MDDGFVLAVVDKQAGVFSGVDRVGRYEIIGEMIIIAFGQKRIEWFNQWSLLRLLQYTALLSVPD